MINKVTLIGNLGIDPELRNLDNGTPVCRFSLATSKSYKDKDGEWQQQTQWHNVVLWRDLATRASETLKKGHQVYVEGEISYRTVQGDNGAQYYTDIVANKFYRLTKVEKSDNHIPGDVPPEFATSAAPSDSEQHPPKDDLPF